MSETVNPNLIQDKECFYTGTKEVSKEYTEAAIQKGQVRIDLMMERFGEKFPFSASRNGYHEFIENKETAVVEAAEFLISRFLDKAGIIQTWGDWGNHKRQGRLIIGCNLNLPPLYSASEITKDESRLLLVKKLPNYFQNRLPEDLIPCRDLSFTDGNGAPRDRSSSAIITCSMSEKYICTDIAESGSALLPVAIFYTAILLSITPILVVCLLCAEVFQGMRNALHGKVIAVMADGFCGRLK